MKKIKGEPIILLGVFLLAITIGGAVALVSNSNSVSVKSNVEKELDKELAKMQSVYDPYVNLENNNNPKNELPNKIEEKEKSETNTLTYAYPCDKDKMRIVDSFDKKYLGVDKSYLDAVMLTPAFNKGCPGMVYRLSDNASVYSISEGVIVDIIDNKNKKFGYTIEIENEQGFKTIYSGLNNVTVSKNQKVVKGQKIGSVGNIDNVLLNNELRFYILEGNVVVDPSKYIGN